MNKRIELMLCIIGLILGLTLGVMIINAIFAYSIADRVFYIVLAIAVCIGIGLNTSVWKYYKGKKDDN